VTKQNIQNSKKTLETNVLTRSNVRPDPDPKPDPKQSIGRLEGGVLHMTEGVTRLVYTTSIPEKSWDAV